MTPASHGCDDDVLVCAGFTPNAILIPLPVWPISDIGTPGSEPLA